MYERVEQELTERIVTEVPLAGADDPLRVLRRGTSTFLDACLEPEVGATLDRLLTALASP